MANAQDAQDDRDEICREFFGKPFAELEGEQRMAAKLLTHGLMYGIKGRIGGEKWLTPHR